MARSILYVGDQDPSMPTQVKDSSGNIVNLTGYTSVQFAFWQEADTATKFKAAGVIVTPSTGSIRYDFAANDLTTGITPGIYNGQWILSDAATKPQHVDAGQFEVRMGR